MKKMRLVVMCAGLLAASVATSACEDTASKEALNICKADLEKLHKDSASQVATIDTTKKQLAEAQNKIAQLTKENEDLKASKQGKAESSSAKKTEAAAKSKK